MIVSEPSRRGPTLGVEALVKVIGRRRVLDGLSFEVRRGTVYGLVGPNGAGKTTLLRCVAGFTRPTSGQVVIHHHSVTRQPSRARHHLGALIDRPGFYPFLTGAENLRELELARGRHRRGMSVAEALELVGMTADGGRRYRTYSKGMGQRLGLAAAVMFEPPLVVLDEPSDGLDPRGIRDVRDLVIRLRDQGTAVLLCTHDLNQVGAVADRIGVLHRGRLLAEGTPGELCAVRPATGAVTGSLEDAVLDLLATADRKGVRG